MNWPGKEGHQGGITGVDMGDAVLRQEISRETEDLGAFFKTKGPANVKM